jgi:hypothetical protein
MRNTRVEELIATPATPPFDRVSPSPPLSPVWRSSSTRTVKQQDATESAYSSLCGIAERECKERL